MLLFVLIQTVKRSADELVLVDPYGIGLTIISVSIVFIVLFSLYLSFRSIGKFFHKMSVKRNTKIEVVNLKHNEEIAGEVCAAIAMALYYYNNQNHDNESSILTIKKKNSEYSPWNSKIYNLRKSTGK